MTCASITVESVSIVTTACITSNCVLTNMITHFSSQSTFVVILMIIKSISASETSTQWIMDNLLIKGELSDKQYSNVYVLYKRYNMLSLNIVHY